MAGPACTGRRLTGHTLLHLAIDFREREIFDWLLSRGADANARAAVDSDGFGGHTPLVQCDRLWPMARYGDDRHAVGARREERCRASLRKFLDWIANPHWYEARDVTAAEWGRGFPEKGWVNANTLQLLGA